MNYSMERANRIVYKSIRIIIIILNGIVSGILCICYWMLMDWLSTNIDYLFYFIFYLVNHNFIYKYKSIINLILTFL